MEGNVELFAVHNGGVFPVRDVLLQYRHDGNTRATTLCETRESLQIISVDGSGSLDGVNKGKSKKFIQARLAHTNNLNEKQQTELYSFKVCFTDG